MKINNEQFQAFALIKSYIIYARRWRYLSLIYIFNANGGLDQIIHSLIASLAPTDTKKTSFKK